MLGGCAAAQVKEVAAEGATWGARVQTIECDLSQFRSVLAAAADVKLACPNGIDVLCCNAGVMALPDSIVTADGCALLPPPPNPLSSVVAAAPGAASGVCSTSGGVSRHSPPNGRAHGAHVRRVERASERRYDLQMTTNHLSHFILVRELMPLLERRYATASTTPQLARRPCISSAQHTRPHTRALSLARSRRRRLLTAAQLRRRRVAGRSARARRAWCT